MEQNLITKISKPNMDLRTRIKHDTSETFGFLLSLYSPKIIKNKVSSNFYLIRYVAYMSNNEKKKNVADIV